MWSAMLEGHNTPCYTTIFRRIKELDIDASPDGMATVRDRRKKIMLIVDSTGLKQSNRGEWLDSKWKFGRRKSVKVHLLVDADTKKILAAMMTDEKTGDAPMLGMLLGQSGAEVQNEKVQLDTNADSNADSNKDTEQDGQRPALICGPLVCRGRRKKIAKAMHNALAAGTSPLSGLTEQDKPQVIMMGDGAYGSRKNIKLCDKLGMQSGLKMNRRVTTKGRGYGRAWSRAVRRFKGGSSSAKIDQLTDKEAEENIRYWKRSTEHNKRWIVEIVISAFKRMFGDHLLAAKWANMEQELRLKIWMYNRWIDEGGGT